MHIEWNEEKNVFLKRGRNVSFEDVLVKILDGDYLDIIPHPNQSAYPHQMVFIFLLGKYVYLVPFVQREDVIFLKTIIPNRKFTKAYREKKYEKN